MRKDYSNLCKHISGNLGDLRRDIPETMRAFSALAQAATKDGALDTRTKELIALALGVAAHCDGCIGFHAEALVKLDVSRKQVEETLAMAIYMGGGPSLMYAADALEAYDQFQERAAVPEPVMD
ncbi:carboxymuconolactone decarboxylase family protein [Bradyrhizobium sp. NAS96.2]|uniref:carboxymuconolactone decarboxylase family protein n=1 Tax=Bradyrhizobium sp. NAS96.2 TaxID=1680160 RepID=UPI00093AA453|nr:carboxymuconolactone decarboxylase family protein [Bradyrhizobium sp. NAS96.2]OKO73081.1 alkylhydroperoxidase [Bradyrhizobium sp. NAS96.2]